MKSFWGKLKFWQKGLVVGIFFVVAFAYYLKIGRGVCRPMSEQGFSCEDFYVRFILASIMIVAISTFIGFLFDKFKYWQKGLGVGILFVVALACFSEFFGGPCMISEPGSHCYYFSRAPMSAYLWLILVNIGIVVIPTFIGYLFGKRKKSSEAKS